MRLLLSNSETGLSPSVLEKNFPRSPEMLLFKVTEPYGLLWKLSPLYLIINGASGEKGVRKRGFYFKKPGGPILFPQAKSPHPVATKIDHASFEKPGA